MCPPEKAHATAFRRKAGIRLANVDEPQANLGNVNVLAADATQADGSICLTSVYYSENFRGEIVWCGRGSLAPGAY